MLTEKLFYEHLEKKYKIEPSDVSSFEVEKSSVVIYMKDGKVVRIHDEELKAYANALIDESIFEDLIGKDGLIIRLYAIKFTYEGLRIPFSEFKNVYQNKGIDELKSEILKYEQEYIRDYGDFVEHMCTSLLSDTIKRKKSKSIPVGIRCDELPYTSQEMAKIIAETSEKDRISLYDIFIRLL